MNGEEKMKLNEILKAKAPGTMKLMKLLSLPKRIVAKSAIGELCEAIEFYIDSRCGDLKSQLDEMQKEIDELKKG